MAGGIAGASSSKIDTIKTRIQSGDSFKEAINKKNFYLGFSFCIFRGFLVNGFGYLGASQII
jgi:hypothetical protein